MLFISTSGLFDNRPFWGYFATMNTQNGLVLLDQICGDTRRKLCPLRDQFPKTEFLLSTEQGCSKKYYQPGNHKLQACIYNWLKKISEQ